MKNETVNTVSIDDLPFEVREFLKEQERIYYNSHDKKETRTAYYFDLQRSGKGGYVSDAFVVYDYEELARTAPKGLYCCGGVMKIVTPYGTIYQSDERKKAFRLPGGGAKYNVVSKSFEIMEAAAYREVITEEIEITAGSTKLVPDYFVEGVNNWDFPTINPRSEATTLEPVGSCERTGIYLNPTTHIAETVLTWTIPQKVIDKNGPLKVFLKEADLPGPFTPFVVKNGQIVGAFCDFQGFVPLNWPILK